MMLLSKFKKKFEKKFDTVMDKMQNLEIKMDSELCRYERMLKENEEQIDKISRIMKNYVPGKITSDSYMSIDSSFETLYVYKDGMECEFRGLYIPKPKFSYGTLKHIVYARDTENGNLYVLNMNTGEYFLIERDSVEDKN